MTPVLVCRDCGAANHRDDRKCWLCGRPDWKADAVSPSAVTVTETSDCARLKSLRPDEPQRPVALVGWVFVVWAIASWCSLPRHTGHRHRRRVGDLPGQAGNPRPCFHDRCHPVDRAPHRCPVRGRIDGDFRLPHGPPQAMNAAAKPMGDSPDDDGLPKREMVSPAFLAGAKKGNNHPAVRVDAREVRPLVRVAMDAGQGEV